MMRICCAMVAAVALLISCGKDSDSKNDRGFLDGKTPTAAADALAGIYNMNEIVNGKPMSDKNAKGRFFMITPNLDFYALVEKDKQYARDYEGSLYDARFSFDGRTFESNSYRGSRLEINSKSPEQFRLLAKIFSATNALIKEAQDNNITIDVVARQTYLSFSENQFAYLSGLKGNIKPLMKKLASQNITSINKIEINDFPNKQLNVRSKWLSIPAGIEFNKSEFKKTLTDDGKEFTVQQY